MIAPANNDAALVREARHWFGNLNQRAQADDESQRVKKLADALAAAAERAEQAERDAGQAWTEYNDSEAALLAAQQERDEARREVDLQMQAKLDAQSLLANIVEAIGLDRSDFDLGDTWRTVGPTILARLTEIVDSAERAEATNTRLREALQWVRLALGWAVFRENRSVWTSNELRDITERIDAALASDAEQENA